MKGILGEDQGRLPAMVKARVYRRTRVWIGQQPTHLRRVKRYATRIGRTRGPGIGARGY